MSLVKTKLNSWLKQMNMNLFKKFKRYMQIFLHFLHIFFHLVYQVIQKVCKRGIRNKWQYIIKNMENCENLSIKTVTLPLRNKKILHNVVMIKRENGRLWPGKPPPENFPGAHHQASVLHVETSWPTFRYSSCLSVYYFSSFLFFLLRMHANPENWKNVFI